MAVSFQGAHFPKEIILMGVHWYIAYPLSTRHVEELMQERGIEVDHSTMNRWVIKYSPQLEEAFHRRRRPVWGSWRMDETYIRVKGQGTTCIAPWTNTARRLTFCSRAPDTEAALRFLTKAIRRHGVGAKITIDGSETNEAAITRYNEEHGTAIIIRQVKYLNNMVEQDHRSVKRITRAMLGFKSFTAAQDTLVGIELMHMIKETATGGRGRGNEPHASGTVLCVSRVISNPAGFSASSLKICDRACSYDQYLTLSGCSTS